MNRLLVASLAAPAALAVLLLAPPARAAGTATNTLTVNATVVGICTIDPATLSFGSYDSTRQLDAAATLTVRCTQGSSYWVGLGLSANASGSTRRMLNGTSSYLAYELYRDDARQQIWDNADPGAASHLAAGTAGYAPYTTTVYARVPAGQIVPMGVYTDTVTMTVNF